MHDPQWKDDATRRLDRGDQLPRDRPEPTPILHERIGDYEVLKKLGEGGMGFVYLAHDRDLDRSVALKIIRSELLADERFITRFQREARLSAALNHPNIVTIYRVGSQGDLPYLAMEFVEGESLRDFLRHPPPKTIGTILDVFDQCCAGLDSAARRGIVHRDFKPANVMVRSDGVVKIMDFGLSKEIDGESFTATSAVMGTPNYMSPEQALGRHVDFRTDVYALGISLFQCVTGYLPFKSSSVFETLRQHREDPLPEDARLEAIAGGRLLRLIAWMTAKRPEDRPQSYSDIRGELAAVREELGEAGLAHTNEGEAPGVAEGMARGFATAPPRSPRIPPLTRELPGGSAPRPSGRRFVGLAVGAGLVLGLGGTAATGFYLGWFDSPGRGVPLLATPADPQPPASGTPPPEADVVRYQPEKGPITIETTAMRDTYPRDILASVGHFASLEPAPMITRSNVTLEVSFKDRTAQDVLGALALAMGWEVTAEETAFGTTYGLGRGRLLLLPAIIQSRAEIDPAEIPTVSINSIAREVTMSQYLRGLSRHPGIDFVLVGDTLPGTPLPPISRSGLPLSTVMEGLKERVGVPFEWTYRRGVLIVVEAPLADWRQGD